MAQPQQAVPEQPRHHIAVVGGGWAGLAAAVEATQRGARVTLIEMAHHVGGRARSLAAATQSGTVHDNGQHILVGAYRDTLALMRAVGIDPLNALRRLPLTLVDPAGNGLRLPPGHPAFAFVRGVWQWTQWPRRDRLRLLATAAGWGLRGFRCRPGTTVAQLAAAAGPRARRDLLDPLCVAALNTPAEEASASVFLRVLHDALFAGPGAADLLLPRAPLDELLPGPARDWLVAHGATLQLGQRAAALRQHASGWVLDERLYDGVILACTAPEAARLLRPIAPAWSDVAAAFTYEPIATVYLHAAGGRLVAPMTTLASDAPEREPAQFAFDHGSLLGRPGDFAFVVSGAAPWVKRGVAALEAAVLAQAQAAIMGRNKSGPPIAVMRTVVEKRATFRCTPALQRPPARVAPGVMVAGDYVEGPYPATLEGAVRSGLAAARALAAMP